MAKPTSVTGDADGDRTNKPRRLAIDVLTSTGPEPFSTAHQRLYVRPVDGDGNYAALPDEALTYLKALRMGGSTGYFAYDAPAKCWYIRHSPEVVDFVERRVAKPTRAQADRAKAENAKAAGSGSKSNLAELLGDA